MDVEEILQRAIRLRIKVLMENANLVMETIARLPETLEKPYTIRSPNTCNIPKNVHTMFFQTQNTITTQYVSDQKISGSPQKRVFYHQIINYDL